MLDCGLLVNTFAVVLILGFALAVLLLSRGCLRMVPSPTLVIVGTGRNLPVSRIVTDLARFHRRC